MSNVRLKQIMYSKISNMMLHKWPSGLRRYVQVVLTSVAQVRTLSCVVGFLLPMNCIGHPELIASSGSVIVDVAFLHIVKLCTLLSSIE